MDGLWSGYIVTCTNSKGEKLEIGTAMGVRGVDIPVTVFLEDGDKYSVIHLGDPVKITTVKKIVI